MRKHKQPHGETTVPADSSSWGPSQQPGLKSPKMWVSEPSVVKPPQPLNIPSRGPRHHRADTSRATVSFQILDPEQSLSLKYGGSFMPLSLGLLHKIDDHYNCFKATEGHGKIWVVKKQDQGFQVRRLTWLQWVETGGRRADLTGKHIYNMAGSMWCKSEYGGGVGFVYTGHIRCGGWESKVQMTPRFELMLAPLIEFGSCGRGSNVFSGG